MRKKLFSNIKRIVIKVGTSVLTSGNYTLSRSRIRELASQVSGLVEKGFEVFLVSSGAIGAGMGVLKLSKRPHQLPLQQALAAIGQSRVMKYYDEAFKKKGLVVAQVLLTAEDLASRQRYLNAKNTVFTLLDNGVIPIINENDTVSVDEIKFGDNDKLSSLAANLVSADLLVILSDVDGFYDENSSLIRVIEEVTPRIERLARGTLKEGSVGGMFTKIQAARIATTSGIPVLIANGREKNILLKALAGEEKGTLFLPRRTKLAAKKRWIAYGARPKGTVSIDKGAKEALLKRKKSLLSRGIVKVEGKFKIGDMVTILGDDGESFACGLINYSAEELEQIKGLKSSWIEAALGHKYYDEVIHRDNMVML